MDRDKTTPSIGDKVRFIPSAFLQNLQDFQAKLRQHVSGTIMYINVPHRFYMVEYYFGPELSCRGRECFKY